MIELVNLIKTLTHDNYVFIDLLTEGIQIIEDEDNELIDNLNKRIRSEIITREANYSAFKEAMKKYNFTKVDEIPCPNEISSEDFSLIIKDFQKSVETGAEKMQEYYKAFSIEYNMINKIKSLGRKNKIDIKF